ncbi:MAG: hypothetical protein INR65_02230 [Gluconacetobacter diazotrophicus]|nr:hypothetical protein [Gluconacetobacter diazotrophicus]
MKDRGIRRALTKLDEILGDGFFDVVDHWEADRTAIGIASPSDHHRLVYIRFLGHGLFDVIREEAPDGGTEVPCVEIGSFEKLRLDEVIEAVRCHLSPTTA